METQHKSNKQSKSANIFFTIEVDTIRYHGLFHSISDHELKLLLALFAFSDNKYTCYPTEEHLASVLNKTEKAIQTTLRSLKKKEFNGSKFLTVTKERLKGNKYYHNKYSLSENLGINIFKTREEILSRKNIGGSFLPIKNTHNTKEDTFIKEKQTGTSFRVERNVDKSKPQSIQELISETPKILKVATQLLTIHPNYSQLKAVNMVKYHIKKLSFQSWTLLYEEFVKTGDIRFYDKVTYKVLRQQMHIDDAIKLSRKEGRI
jgi:hypothetical protein